MNLSPSIAYFSMEIGLVAELPTYAGGLGVLAGDTIRSAADRGLDMVAVTLVHRRGYFRQQLDADGCAEREAAPLVARRAAGRDCLRGPPSASRAAPCSCERGATT